MLYSFRGGADGVGPDGNFIVDSNGAFYGTAGGGDARGDGIVFKLTPTPYGYGETVLYRFQGGRDGSGPRGGLIADKAGALYGTTFQGGRNGSGCNGECGTVFKLTPFASGYTESILHRFRGGSDGANPSAGLMADLTGALYGTTAYGGGGPCNGCGTVFKLTPSDSGYVESVIYRFQGGYDGLDPEADLVADSMGALYGTTYLGGGPRCDNGCGTVFKLTPGKTGYSESVLYSFQGGSDGAAPSARVLIGKGGVVYGTASLGGSSLCYCGTVFELIPGALTGSP